MDKVAASHTGADPERGFQPVRYWVSSPVNSSKCHAFLHVADFDLINGSILFLC